MDIAQKIMLTSQFKNDNFSKVLSAVVAVYKDQN